MLNRGSLGNCYQRSSGCFPRNRRRCAALTCHTAKNDVEKINDASLDIQDPEFHSAATSLSDGLEYLLILSRTKTLAYFNFGVVFVWQSFVSILVFPDFLTRRH